MTLYLEEDRHCDPSAAESHEEEATNHQRSSAQTLDSKTLQNGHRGENCDISKEQQTGDFLSTYHSFQPIIFTIHGLFLVLMEHNFKK